MRPPPLLWVLYIQVQKWVNKKVTSVNKPSGPSGWLLSPVPVAWSNWQYSFSTPCYVILPFLFVFTYKFLLSPEFFGWLWLSHWVNFYFLMWNSWLRSKQKLSKLKIFNLKIELITKGELLVLLHPQVFVIQSDMKLKPIMAHSSMFTYCLCLPQACIWFKLWLLHWEVCVLWDWPDWTSFSVL